jgi:hypothetical protein
MIIDFSRVHGSASNPRRAGNGWLWRVAGDIAGAPRIAVTGDTRGLRAGIDAAQII